MIFGCLAVGYFRFVYDTRTFIEGPNPGRKAIGVGGYHTTPQSLLQHVECGIAIYAVRTLALVWTECVGFVAVVRMRLVGNALQKLLVYLDLVGYGEHPPVPRPAGSLHLGGSLHPFGWAIRKISRTGGDCQGKWRAGRMSDLNSLAVQISHRLRPVPRSCRSGRLSYSAFVFIDAWPDRGACVREAEFLSCHAAAVSESLMGCGAMGSLWGLDTTRSWRLRPFSASLCRSRRTVLLDQFFRCFDRPALWQRYQRCCWSPPSVPHP